MPLRTKEAIPRQAAKIIELDPLSQKNQNGSLTSIVLSPRLTMCLRHCLNHLMQTGHEYGLVPGRISRVMTVTSNVADACFGKQLDLAIEEMMSIGGKRPTFLEQRVRALHQQ